MIPQSPSRPLLARYTAELLSIFRRTRDKHRAHERSRAVLADMAGDPACLRAALEEEMERPGALNIRHYPSVLLSIAHNAHFGLVANCFLPLPSGETDVTSNSIHHHGHMLLTTATAFGPGYEHWRFTTPRRIEGGQADLFSMQLRDRAVHALHDIAFVDEFMPHAVVFPPGLTVTFALWSSRHPVTWRDRVKRLPVVDRHRDRLLAAARRLGVSGSLRINVERYFDYYPVPGGFRGMPERVQFQRGPNEDFLHTFFCILQQTGNEALAPDERLLGRVPVDAPDLVRRLAGDLRAGRPIAHRFSEGLHWLPHMNFKVADIERSLAANAAAAASSAPIAAAVAAGR